jgi:D-beta-D-heptose 7-phosphate kinase/D-beta-D-heptose 1-phosphate adenosyltransferase
VTERAHLAHLVERIAGQGVLCVGDVMLDRFVIGRVERISPEAPIPVFNIERATDMLGGAGNVVRNLAALGAHVRFVGAIGDDDAGLRIETLLGELAGAQARLCRITGRRSGIKTRFLAGGQQMLRTDEETVAPLLADNAQSIVAAATGFLADVAVVVLSDYGKGVLSEAVMGPLIAAARAAGKVVIVDPKHRDFARYRGATILTPNRKELAEATGLPTSSDEDIAAAAARVIEQAGIDTVVATRSQDGMSVICRTGETAHLKAEAREVFDVSGAGDTVVAMLAAALAGGAHITDAAALANVAAGIVVAKVGTAVAYPDDIVAALHHQDFSDAEAKILALSPALDRIAQWRRQGHRIGFTNGCFDLLHPGHLSLIRQAKAACDRLVVGVNSDASVGRLKGAGRPLQAEAARAAVLASLAAIDLVLVFEDDTPKRLIEAVRPDVLVKGADYSVEQVVGADFVQAYGGRVVLAELKDGFSTTATVARIRG